MSYRERPWSSRERRPGSSTGRSNIARVSSAGVIRPSPRTQQTIRDLNEPLVVNRLYCTNQEPLTPRKVTPILPPSRYPTLPPDNPTPRKRVPSCPQAWIDSNMRSSNNRKPSIEEKVNMTQKFIEKHAGRMHEFRYEYTNKSPRTIRDSIVKSPHYNKLMDELQHKERVLTKGTSSYNMRQCLSNDRQKSVRELQFDPHNNSLNTSRNDRDEKMRRLFAAETKLHATDKRHSRGYMHVPDYGNFSNYNGYLVKNRGTMLSR